MSSSTPLLQTIEPDDLNQQQTSTLARDINSSAAREDPIKRPNNVIASTLGDVESGVVGIFKQSSHPLVLLVLYLLRSASIAVYVLCGFFTDNYVLSTVIVVVLLAMDFWNCRNVAGRTLVGLRYWNQVDDDGESYWVFESHDPSRPANAVDAKMFWIALYTFPLLWVALLAVSILKFNISFMPIVILGLVFNLTNAIGFTYADRDAKRRWAQEMSSSGWNISNLGTQFIGSALKSSVSRAFRG